MVSMQDIVSHCTPFSPAAVPKPAKARRPAARFGDLVAFVGLLTRDLAVRVAQEPLGYTRNRLQLESLTWYPVEG